MVRIGAACVRAAIEERSAIRKLTGHRSRELERYEHLSPVLKRQTVELIVQELSDTATDTANFGKEGKFWEVIERNGGDDGARTRDLRRDRTEAKSAANTDLIQVHQLASVVGWPFRDCYSTCYSSPAASYARSGI